MKFQQGTQKIEVIVRKGGGSGYSSGGNGTSQPQGAKTTEDVSTSGTATTATGQKKNRAMSKNSIMHYTNAAKQIALKVGNYYISGIKYSTGDEALQDMVDRKIEVVTDFSNLAAQTAFGAFYGSRYGVAGAVIGGSLSFVSGATSITTNYASKQREYNMKLFKEENGIVYRRARADINFTTGRLR